MNKQAELRRRFNITLTRVENDRLFLHLVHNSDDFLGLLVRTTHAFEFKHNSGSYTVEYELLPRHDNEVSHNQIRKILELIVK